MPQDTTGYLDASVDYKGLFNTVQPAAAVAPKPTNITASGIKASVNQTNGTATITGTLSATTDVKNIQVAYYVKHANANIATAKWYNATVSGKTFTVNIPLSAFTSQWGTKITAGDIGHFDVYQLHSSNGSQTGIGSTTYTFPSMGTLGGNITKAGATFNVNVTALPSNVKAIQDAAWDDSVGGQDDLSWSNMSKVSTGYQHTETIAAHKAQLGHYTADVYVENQMGEVESARLSTATNPIFNGITAKNVTLSYGQAWSNAAGYVSGYNSKGAAIPVSAVTASGTVKTTTPGTYKVNYSYKDPNGQTLTATSNVTVNASKASFSTTNFFTWANAGMWTSDIMKNATDVNGNKMTIPASGNGVPTNVTATVKNSMGTSFTWQAFTKGAPAGTYTVTFGLGGKTATSTVTIFNKVGSGANFKATYVHGNNVTCTLTGMQMIQNNWYLFDKTTGQTKTGVQDITPYGQAKSMFFSKSNAMAQYGVITDGSTHYFAQAGSGALQTGWLTSSMTGLGYNVYATTWGTNEFKFETGTQTIDGHTYNFLASGQCWQQLN